jgi:hypothetical protein
MKFKLLLLSLAAIAIGGCAPTEDVQTVDDGHARSIPGQAMERGKEVELESNMNQVRQFVGMYRQDNDGRNPTLDELKHMRQFVPSLLINPVDGKPLIYDQATGTVYPQGGKAPSKDSRASQINNSETGSAAPPPAALPQSQPADPDAPSAPAAPAIPAIPGGAGQ